MHCVLRREFCTSNNRMYIQLDISKLFSKGVSDKYTLISYFGNKKENKEYDSTDKKQDSDPTAKSAELKYEKQELEFASGKNQELSSRIEPDKVRICKQCSPKAINIPKFKDPPWWVSKLYRFFGIYSSGRKFRRRPCCNHCIDREIISKTPLNVPTIDSHVSQRCKDALTGVLRADKKTDLGLGKVAQTQDLKTVTEGGSVPNDKSPVPSKGSMDTNKDFVAIPTKNCKWYDGKGSVDPKDPCGPFDKSKTLKEECSKRMIEKSKLGNVTPNMEQTNHQKIYNVNKLTKPTSRKPCQWYDKNSNVKADENPCSVFERMKNICQRKIFSESESEKKKEAPVILQEMVTPQKSEPVKNGSYVGANNSNGGNQFQVPEQTNNLKPESTKETPEKTVPNANSKEYGWYSETYNTEFLKRFGKEEEMNKHKPIHYRYRDICKRKPGEQIEE